VEVEKTGKPAPVMRDAELPFAVDNLRFFEDAAR
jgi:betaine-aldehyde dehydrogenase